MNCNLVRGGFSFCGVNIAELGLSYAPENENTYVYRPTEVDVHQETFAGHDGGYFYGVTRKPKEFTLRCYFEDEAIDRGVMERIYHLFRTGKSGKLIFDRKPWEYYYATVTSLPHPELSNYMNGLITITMTASYPFARGDALYYDITKNADENTKEDDFVYESTALLENEAMVPQTHFVDLEEEITADKPLIIHNPGTEFTPLSIAIAGDAGSGVIISNETTGQDCKIIVMDKAHTSDNNKFIYIDGMNGSTSVMSERGVKEPGFVYHEYGFIELAPAYPMLRDVYIKYIEGTTVALYNTLFSDVKDKYIYIVDGWYKIKDSTDTTLELYEEPETKEGFDRTLITLMNEITVKPLDTMDLSRLSFIFKPTYA